MTYEGWLNLGGNEIVNSPRAIGYTRSGDCPIYWLDGDDCETLAEALGHDVYDRQNISAAPWYDPDIPDVSSRFLGAHAVSIEGIDDSTRQAVMTQKTTDGGQVSGYRHGTKAVRVRAMLTGRGQDALDYGMTWLRSALEPGACGVHSVSCGTTSLEYLVACPEPGASTDDVDALRRYLHGVVCTSGPLVQQRMVSNDGQHYGAIVEFTLEAESAFVYSVQREVALPPVTPVVVQDVVYNLAPYPSAELASGTVVMSTNLSLNPSVESNVDQWGTNHNSALSAAGTISPAVRSTEIAAVGSASARGEFVATAAGTGGQLRIQQAIPLTGPAGARYSANMWATGVVSSGTAVLEVIDYYAIWRDASSEIGVDKFAELPPSGGAASAVSLVPPPGAITCYLRAQLRITSWQAGAVVRIYADAVALTNP